MTRTVTLTPIEAYYWAESGDGPLSFNNLRVGTEIAAGHLWGFALLFNPINVPSYATITAASISGEILSSSGSTPDVLLYYNNVAAKRDIGPDPIPGVPPDSDWTGGFGSSSVAGEFTLDIDVVNTWRETYNWILFNPATDDEGGYYNMNCASDIFSITYTVPNYTGVETTDGDYTVLTFNQYGTFTPNNDLNVDALIIGGGGGGGGGSGRGGGGGAGGMLYQQNISLTANTAYNVIVGEGGAGSFATGGGWVKGYNGGYSIFTDYTSIGGGGGGNGPNSNNSTGPARTGNDGGSGGGAADYAGTTAGGSGTVGQGNDGGIGLEAANAYGSGGGGGAGEVGGNGSSTAGGTGGAGSSNSISGSSVTYAGGGGGSANIGTPGVGGTGGGGVGAQNSGPQQQAGDGTDGLGGGGGGGTDAVSGGDGGNGVVILRYLTADNEIPATASTQNFINFRKKRLKVNS